MALRPEDRYPSAAALARDIERYLANEPTHVGGESLGERLLRWQRKYPGLATGLSAALAVLLLAVLSLTWVAFELNAARKKERLALLDTRTAERKTREEAARREAIQLEQFADRGAWKAVLDLVDRPVLNAHADPIQRQLLRLDALNALGRSAELKQALQDLNERPDFGTHRGQVLLWQAESDWTLLTGPSAKLIQEALHIGLPPADQAYAEALLARTIPEAIVLLKRAVKVHPFHYRANRLLGANLIVCGISEGTDRVKAQQYLFPADPNFPFLLALAATFERDQEGAAHHLKQLHSVATEDFAENAAGILDLVESIVLAGEGDAWCSPARLVLALPGLALKWEQLSTSLAKSSRDRVPDLPPQLFCASRKVVEGLIQWQSSGLFGGLLGNRRDAAVANLKEAAEILPITTFLTLYGKLLSLNGANDEALAVLDQAYLAPVLFPEARKYTLIFLAERYATKFMEDPESEAGKQAEDRVYALMEELLDTKDPQPYVLAACDQFLHLNDRTKLKAHHTLERSHVIDPANVDVASMLARSHLRQGNHWRALKVADEVLARNVDDRRAKEVRSQALEVLEQWKSSLDASKPTESN